MRSKGEGVMVAAKGFSIHFRIRTAGKTVLLPFAFLCLLLQWGQTQASTSEGVTTQATYIQALARKLPASTILPPSSSSLSLNELHAAVLAAMENRGIIIAAPRGMHSPLTRMDFIDVTYAFLTEQPAATNIERKYYLKDRKIVKPEDIGIFHSYEGLVTATRHLTKSVLNVTGSEPLLFRDTIETDDDSRVELLFDDQSVLTLGEDTLIEINEMLYDPRGKSRETLVKIAHGTLRVKAAKISSAASNFRVETPTAVIGVRGTEFVVKVDRGGSTRVITIEGLVAFRSRAAIQQSGEKDPDQETSSSEAGEEEDGTVLVAANNVGFIDANGAAALIAISAEELSQAMLSTTLLNPWEVSGGGVISLEEILEVLKANFMEGSPYEDEPRSGSSDEEGTGDTLSEDALAGQPQAEIAEYQEDQLVVADFSGLFRTPEEPYRDEADLASPSPVSDDLDSQPVSPEIEGVEDSSLPPSDPVEPVSPEGESGGEPSLPPSDPVEPVSPEGESGGDSSLSPSDPVEPVSPGGENSGEPSLPPNDPVEIAGEDFVNQEALKQIRAYGARNALWGTVDHVLNSGDIRQRDAALATIADAKAGRVLKDVQGNWLRVQQYVFRPDDKTVQVVNVNLRLASPDRSGLTVLDWQSSFAKTLPGGSDLLTLPWADFLTINREGGHHVLSSSDYELRSMSATFRTDTDTLTEIRVFNSIANSGNSRSQNIQIGAESLIVDGNAFTYDAGLSIDGSYRMESTSGDNQPFRYALRTGGTTQYIDAYFYVVGDATSSNNTGLISGYNNLEFKDLWHALSVNFTSSQKKFEKDIGTNNLEMRFVNGADSSLLDEPLDLVYIPLPRMEWKAPEDAFQH
jgi:hypothetical protein